MERPLWRRSKNSTIPRGDKSSYTGKQQRQAEHIEQGYKEKGLSTDEAERRAWATVNKQDGGGKKAGSGRWKAVAKSAVKKGTARKTEAKSASRKGTAEKAETRQATGKKSAAKKAGTGRSTVRKAAAKKTASRTTRKG
ncbi:MAG TPA: hypothetical protein VGE21_11800 [Flavobacteriales bacterium]